jgi:RimJ/RimL family protein N-acetyltransferase
VGNPVRGRSYVGRVLWPAYPIRTARLQLRPLESGDAAALHRYQSRADVCRYIPYPPRSLEQIQARLADPAITRAGMDDAGQALPLAVVRSADAVLVGDVVLMWHSREHGAGEIGYVFDPEHQGQGYATETCAALLGLGFAQLGLHRIVARLDARNTASAGVARRLGMRQEAHLTQNEWFKGEWTDELDFAILAAEWEAAGSG